MEEKDTVITVCMVLNKVWWALEPLGKGYLPLLAPPTLQPKCERTPKIFSFVMQGYNIDTSIFFLALQILEYFCCFPRSSINNIKSSSLGSILFPLPSPFFCAALSPTASREVALCTMHVHQHTRRSGEREEEKSVPILLAVCRAPSPRTQSVRVFVMKVCVN